MDIGDTIYVTKIIKDENGDELDRYTLEARVVYIDEITGAIDAEGKDFSVTFYPPQSH